MTQDEINKRLDEQLRLFADFKRANLPWRAAGKFCGAEEIVLQHGRDYARDTASRDKPLMKECACFENALTLALWFPKSLVYCEGYAMSVQSGLIVHHAWVVHRLRGTAIDLTWDWTAGPYAYRGIEFEQSVLGERQIHFNRFCMLDGGSLGDLCRYGMPVLETA